MLIPTPIGNLGDMTARAIATLKAADLVLCEDTRVTARLLSYFAIQARTLPMHDHNEEGRIVQVLDMLRQGQLIAVVSDAGTPLVSDPGFRLVRAVIAAGMKVHALPGPNAALLALTLSGLPPHPFLFMGFPPPKQAARRAAFAGLRAAERAGLRATLVWYEAPHRLAETLADIAEVLGDRAVSVGRELTKRFEETIRGSAADLAARFKAEAPRGEITLVVAPAEDEAADTDDLAIRLRTAMTGHSLKQAVAIVTAETGLPRKQVYAKALEIGAEG